MYRNKCLLQHNYFEHMPKATAHAESVSWRLPWCSLHNVLRACPKSGGYPHRLFHHKKRLTYIHIYIPLRSITDIWGYPNFGQTFITSVFKSRSETSVCVCVWTCDAGKAWCGARYKTVSSQRGFTWYEATPSVGTARLASFFSASHWLVTSCQTESLRGVAKERAHEWPIQRSDVLGIPNWKKVLAMHWTWLYNIVHRSQVPITLICWHVSYAYLH